MKNTYKNIFLLLTVIFSFSACELDLQESPNQLGLDDINEDYVLNGIALSFNGMYENAQSVGATITRQENLFGSNWNNALRPQDTDGLWTVAYSVIFNCRELAKRAEDETAQLYHHAAIAQTLQAYTMFTLVDYYGDVPYSNAFDAGNGNFTPTADEGEAVYNAAFDLLEQARANFAKTPARSANGDMFYGGNAAKWTKLVNTMEFKYAVQIRNFNAASAKARVDAMMAEDAGGMIEASSDAFVFQFGTNQTAPASQNFNYNNNYSNGANDYASNYFMNMLMNDKSKTDPRIKYYYFRQIVYKTNDSSIKTCVGNAPPTWYGSDQPFCILEDGYFGRDHLDNGGIPPDNEVRTVYGVYPAGGSYDNGAGGKVQQGDGKGGAGISPIIMPFTTSFLKAEAMLTMGVAGDARAMLEEGMRNSFNYVYNFSQEGVKAAYDSEVEEYVTEVLSNYDDADAAGKLGVVMKEYYLASWGNGIDAYNNYRRTGFPDNMQPGYKEETKKGEAPTTLFYPVVFVDRNTNAKQKENLKVKTFWDNDDSVEIQ